MCLSNFKVCHFMFRNTTPNVTIPIRVTIRSQGGSEDVNGRLRNIVETEVKRFGYDLSINESIRLHSKLKSFLKSLTIST